jgi:hypothetical protein
MRRLVVLALASCLGFMGALLVAGAATAHQSGCHRWHSCPSDSGSYVCGDLGYACQYPSDPTYPDPTYVDPPTYTPPTYTPPTYTPASGTCDDATVRSSYRGPYAVANRRYAQCSLEMALGPDSLPSCSGSGRKAKWQCTIYNSSSGRFQRVWLHVTPRGMNVITPR